MESQFSFLFLQLSTVTENKYLFKMNIQSVNQLETQYFHFIRMKSVFQSLRRVSSYYEKADGLDLPESELSSQ